MKRLLMITMMLMCHMALKAQGIKFEERSLSWEQILAKAKKENKIIFVDAYATWCGPCKEMEANIFPQKETGDFFNTHFINVKVQMDRTFHDAKGVKDWYANASYLAGKYRIHSFPSYLFFSADGTLVHKFIGYNESDAFIKKANYALSPRTQYYVVKDNWKANQNDTSILHQAKDFALDAGDDENIAALNIAYLNANSTGNKTLSNEYIDVLFQTMKNTGDESFKTILENIHLIDSVKKNEGLAERELRNIVFQEKILTIIKETNGKTNWTDLGKKLAGEYPSLYGDYKRQVDSSFFNNLIHSARRVPDREVFNIIICAYRYSVREPFDKANIVFMLDNTAHTNDNGFSFLEVNVKKLDLITGGRAVSKKLCEIIFNDELVPKFEDINSIINYKTELALLNQDHPLLVEEMKSVFKDHFYNKVLFQVRDKIQRYNGPIDLSKIIVEQGARFPGYDLEKILLETQCDYYAGKEVWDTCIIKSKVLLKKYGRLLSTSDINNISYDYVFSHSSDNEAIDLCLRYLKPTLESEPHMETLDTYANLLYKAGRRNEAILYETKILEMLKPDAKNPTVAQWIIEYQHTIDNMKVGKKMWMDDSPVINH